MNARKWLFSVIMAIIESVLVAIIYTEVKEAPNKELYLDGFGVGAAVWAVLILAFAIFTLFLDPSTIPKIEQELEVSEVERAFGTREELFRLYPPGRLVRAGICCLQAGCNFMFVVYNFVVLPERDPEEHLNMSKHIVAWVEFPCVCALSAACLISSSMMWSGRDASACRKLSTFTQSLANFSVLKAFPLANPINLAKEVTPLLKDASSIFMVFPFAMLQLVMAFAGALSVIIKIDQVDFIAQKTVPEWSAWEFFALLGFMNNLAGLRSDGAQEKILGSIRAKLCTDERVDELQLKSCKNRFKDALASHTLPHYGPLGVAIIDATLTADDVCIVSTLDPPTETLNLKEYAPMYATFDSDGAAPCMPPLGMPPPAKPPGILPLRMPPSGMPPPAKPPGILLPSMPPPNGGLPAGVPPSMRPAVVPPLPTEPPVPSKNAMPDHPIAQGPAEPKEPTEPSAQTPQPAMPSLPPASFVQPAAKPIGRSSKPAPASSKAKLSGRRPTNGTKQTE